MNTSKARRSRPRNRTNVDRIVANKIRQLKLNSPATWCLTKSRVTDPPPYNEDALYQRKIRMTLTTIVGGASIPATFFPTYGGFATDTFAFVQVTRASAYSKADGNGIRLSTTIVQPDGTLIADREFSDAGMQGAARAAVHVIISPKDTSFISCTDTGTMFTVDVLNTVGASIVGDVICDFTVMFKNTARVTRENIDYFKQQQIEDATQEQSWDSAESHAPNQEIDLRDFLAEEISDTESAYDPRAAT